ncbi:MAG: hypothetical protein ACRD0S_11685, partial [Acidimicrobiales bacterium]
AHPDPDDAAFLAGAAADLGLPLVATVPFEAAVVEADRIGVGPDLGAGPLRAPAEAVLDWLDSGG